MFGTLVVGLGRSGLGLHVPAVRRIRHGDPEPGPLVGVDPMVPAGATQGLIRAGSVQAAASIADPAGTVVHLCTGPEGRADLLRECASVGFTRFVIEKPLAVDEPGLDEVLGVIADSGLDVVGVAQWLCSGLTARLRGLAGAEGLGALQSIAVHLRKPRFTRSLAANDHPTAFDVELPHAVAVALALAGTARVINAGCTDLVMPEATFAALGSAWLVLEHDGVRSRISSTLTAPVRERRIEVRFERGVATGHYPCSEADHYSQLRIVAPGRSAHTVFADDSLTAFMYRAYRHLCGGPRWPENLSMLIHGTRLLMNAKTRHRADPTDLSAVVGAMR